jgi:hypothetical protein
LALCLAPCAFAQSDVPKVLFSNLPGSPTRTVPGSNLVFQAGVNPSDAFLSLAVAPGGDRWAIRARVVPSSGGAATDAIVTGVLDNTTGARMIARTTETSYVSSRTWDSFGASLAANDANQVAFAANLSGATTDDELVTRWTDTAGGTWTTIAREDTQALAQPPGVRYGPVLQSIHLLPSGLVGLHASLFVGASTLQALYHLSAPGTGSLIASNATTTPTGQLAAPAQSLSIFSLDRCTTGGDAGSGVASWYVGRLAGPTATDMVLTRNNAVIAQEGFVKPGSGFSSPVLDLALVPPISASFASSVGPGGPGGEALYFGTNADATDWAAAWSCGGDAVIARTGGAIVAGSSETWSDADLATTFLGGAMNPTNVWVLAGKTTAASDADTVIVHESAGVVLREGVGIDLNGDGFANDNAILADIAPASVRFGSNGRVYAIVQIRNPAGTPRGWALVRFLTPIGNVCDSIDFNNDGSLFDPTDIDAFLSVFSEGPCLPAGTTCNDLDFNNDGSLFDPADIDSFLSVFSEGPCL